MLIIRFQRIGKKNQPFFRVVLTEKTAPPQGKYIEKLGYLNPRSKECNFDSERIQYWIQKGTQVSDTAWNLLVNKGIIKNKKKRPIKIKIKKSAKTESKGESKNEPKNNSKNKSKSEPESESKSENKPETEK